jgi:hypothetical protein
MMYEGDIEPIGLVVPGFEWVAGKVRGNYTEFCKSSWSAWKDIPVYRDSPDIQMLPALGNGVQVSSSDISRSRLDTAFWRNRCSNPPFTAKLGDEGRAFRQIFITECILNINAQTTRWRVPAIYPGGTYSPENMAVPGVFVGYPAAPAIVNVGPFTCYHGDFGGVRTIASGFGGNFSVTHTGAHVTQLPDKQSSLEGSDNDQSNRRDSQDARVIRETFFVQLMRNTAIMFLGSLTLCIWGGYNLYRDRILTGAASMGGGLLLGLGGWFYFWLAYDALPGGGGILL